MPRGRPVKCVYCGSYRTANKGFRRTVSLGLRRLKKCRDCGRRFTVESKKARKTKRRTSG